MLPCFFKALKNPDLNYLTSVHPPFPPSPFLFCFLYLDVFISCSVTPGISFLLLPSCIFHSLPLFALARGRFSYLVAITFCDISRLLSGLLLCVKCLSFYETALIIYPPSMMHNEITILKWLFHVEVMEQRWVGRMVSPDGILVQDKPRVPGERES